jgi:hypothetical protein
MLIMQSPDGFSGNHQQDGDIGLKSDLIFVHTPMGRGRLIKILCDTAYVEMDFMYLVEFQLSDIEIIDDADINVRSLNDA